MDDQFSAKAKQAEANVSKLEESLTGLKSKAAAAFSIGAVVRFGKSVVDSLKNYEYFHASIKTMLHGNINMTTALEHQLQDLAKTTPFELKDVQDSTRQLMAYGFQAGDITTTLRTLGDVSAGVGSDIKDVVYLYGTLRTSGRVALTDVNQFANRGIPIWETLAKRLNKATEEVRELVGAGKIGFKDIEGAFKDMTKEGGQFFNLMNDQSKTIGGQLSSMSDSWDQLKVEIGKSQKGILSGTVTFFSGMVSTLQEFIAASNRRESAYDKYGGKDFNWVQKIGANIAKIINPYLNLLGVNIDSAVKGQSDFEQGLQNRYVKNVKTPLQAKTSEVDLRNLLAAQYNAFEQKVISKDELDRRQAVIRSTIDEVKSLYDLMKTKQDPIVPEPKAKETDKEAAKVKQQQYTNITINIHDGLVHEFNVNTATVEGGAQNAKAIVLKGLIEAVNDSQIVAGN